MTPESRATLWFGLASAAAVALAVVYAEGGQPQAEGILLAVTFGGIGSGIVVWAKAATPHDEVTEERHPLESSDEDIAEFTVVGTRGPAFLVRTDLDAPKRKVIAIDPRLRTGRAGWTTVVPEKEHPLEAVAAVGGS